MSASNYLMNEVKVTTTVDGDYKIEMFPVNCSFPFSLMTTKNGPNGITREKSASPPVTGTFDLTYGSHALTGMSQVRYRYNTSACRCVTSACRCLTSACRCVTSACRCVTSACRCLKSACRCLTSACRCVTSACRCVTSACEFVTNVCKCVISTC